MVDLGMPDSNKLQQSIECWKHSTLTTSGATPAGQAAQVKCQQLRLRDNHPKGYQLPPKEKMTSLMSDEKHLWVWKQEGVDSLPKCQIALHICLDETWILSDIFMVNVEERQSSIKWRGTAPPLSIT